MWMINKYTHFLNLISVVQLIFFHCWIMDALQVRKIARPGCSPETLDLVLSSMSSLVETLSLMSSKQHIRPSLWNNWGRNGVASPLVTSLLSAVDLPDSRNWSNRTHIWDGSSFPWPGVFDPSKQYQTEFPLFEIYPYMYWCLYTGQSSCAYVICSSGVTSKRWVDQCY